MTLLLLLPGPASPATITVDDPSRGSDGDGLCDLVEAVQNANTDSAANSDCEAGDGPPVVDVIELSVDVTLDEVFAETAQSRGPIGVPRIVSEMVIRGGGGARGPRTVPGEVLGATPRTIRRDPAASDDFRFFLVALGASLTLEQVTLSGGLVEDVPDTLASGTLGGAIFNLDELILTQSTISGNSVSADGQAGPGVFSYAYGGGIFNLGTLSVTESTISGNSVYATDTMFSPYSGGAGISNGAFFYDEMPMLTLSYSTVSGNLSDSVGAMRANTYGGGLFAERGTVDVVNSTISGNTAQGYGSAATYVGGAGLEVNGAEVVLRHSTVAANVKIETGGGVEAYGAGVDVVGTGYATLYGSLVGHQVGENCFRVTDGGENLADDDTCGPTIPDTLVGLDPILADNGGPTRTHRMTSSSTARDEGGACGLPTDQRGVDRAIDGLCDSGAYEFFCGAEDEDVLLADDVLTIERTVEACGMITGGPAYEVAAGGDLIARAGSRMVLDNGFRVSAGGRLSVEIDPGIQMPDAASPLMGADSKPVAPTTRPTPPGPATPQRSFP